jgi:hypothetical protein
MSQKSINLHGDGKTVNSGNVLGLLFGEREGTLKAAKTLVGRMKSNSHLAMTNREMRFFAKELQSGKGGVKYSYHNFYIRMLRKLLDLGFVENHILNWDDRGKKTEAVYQLKLQPIPERPPQGGFVKQSVAIGQGLE